MIKRVATLVFFILITMFFSAKAQPNTQNSLESGNPQTTSNTPGGDCGLPPGQCIPFEGANIALLFMAGAVLGFWRIKTLKPS